MPVLNRPSEAASKVWRRRLPDRPNMAQFLLKTAGVLLLVATVGVVSCQAVLSDGRGPPPPAAQG